MTIENRNLSNLEALIVSCVFLFFLLVFSIMVFTPREFLQNYEIISLILILPTSLWLYFQRESILNNRIGRWLASENFTESSVLPNTKESLMIFVLFVGFSLFVGSMLIDSYVDQGVPNPSHIAVDRNGSEVITCTTAKEYLTADFADFDCKKNGNISHLKVNWFSQEKDYNKTTTLNLSSGSDILVSPPIPGRYSLKSQNKSLEVSLKNSGNLNQLYVIDQQTKSSIEFNKLIIIFNFLIMISSLGSGLGLVEKFNTESTKRNSEEAKNNKVTAAIWLISWVFFIFLSFIIGFAARSISHLGF